jgi:hypothetical protein
MDNMFFLFRDHALDADRDLKVSYLRIIILKA